MTCGRKRPAIATSVRRTSFAWSSTFSDCRRSSGRTRQQQKNAQPPLALSGLRTTVTKRPRRRSPDSAMVFELLEAAEEHCRYANTTTWSRLSAPARSSRRKCCGSGPSMGDPCQRYQGGEEYYPYGWGRRPRRSAQFAGKDLVADGLADALVAGVVNALVNLDVPRCPWPWRAPRHRGFVLTTPTRTCTSQLSGF